MDKILDKYSESIVDNVMDGIADGETDAVTKTRGTLICMLEEIRLTFTPTEYRPKMETKEAGK